MVSLVRKLFYEMDVWKYWPWSLLCYAHGSETALRAECWTLLHFLLPLSQKDCSLLCGQECVNVVVCVFVLLVFWF